MKIKFFVITVALLLQVCISDRKGTLLSKNLQGLVTEYLTPLSVAKVKAVEKNLQGLVSEAPGKCLAGNLFEHRETKEILFVAEGNMWRETELPGKLSRCHSKREELEEYIAERDWDSLFNRISGNFSKELQESLADIVEDTDAALEHAIPFGTARTVENLLKRKTKAELNGIYGWTGWTRLIEAVDTGREEIVEMLLQFGADVNGIDKNGETALCRAVVRNQSHMVKLLLKCGACRFIKGFRGNALDIAKERSNDRIFELLQNYTNTIQIPYKFQTETQAEEEEKAERLLIFRLFIDEQNKRGETPLMAAVRKNDVVAVGVLLNFDARLDIRNNKGKSALDIAQNKKNVHAEIIKLLQDKMQE